MKKSEWLSWILFIAIFLVCFFVPNKNCNSSDHAIVVQGNWEVYATPDTMILSLRVEETKPTTEESQKIVDEKITKVKEILKKYNINTSDIKTTNVNTYESFDWRDSGRVPLWYTSSHSLEVKIKDVTAENEWVAGKIISEISKVGWVLINNISYDIYDKTVYYSEARKLAMQKAQQKAEELAELWEVKLWKPISIQEERNYDYAVGSMAMKNSYTMDMEEWIDDDAWDISLWEMKISLDVSVSYKIK